MGPITGQIEQAEAKEKSVRLQVNGRWFSSKEKALANMVGTVITFTPETSEFRGKTYYWINDYQQGTQAPQPVVQSNSGMNPPVGQASGAQASMFLNKDLLPMTSNTVAHAIQAGLIKEPTQVYDWAVAAANAAHKVLTTDRSQEDEFGDEIPF